jgi:hypothetical protein
MRSVPVFHLGHISRVLLGTGVLSLSLLTGPFLSRGAHAELAGCYTDPVIVLSNGTTLDLSDTIGDMYTDVQQASYVLHAPVGTWVTSVTYTSGPIGPKEVFYFYADNAPGQYNVTSRVTTLTSGVSVVASADVVSLAGASGASDSGWNNQPLKIQLSQ